MNVLICDDEINNITDIKNHVSLFMKEHNLPVTFFEFTSGEEAIKDKIKYDIAFMDIEMDGLNGIDTAKELKKINNNIVIFIITAYDKYLDDAMDLNILRYLCKPLNVERLYKGLEKALELIDNTLIDFYLKKDNSLMQVPISSIIYIEIENRGTKIVTDENTYYSKESIKYWREKLIQSYFYSVHSSFIINMNYITNYKRDELVLNKEYVIPISYRKQAEYRKIFLQFMENR